MEDTKILTEILKDTLKRIANLENKVYELSEEIKRLRYETLG